MTAFDKNKARRELLSPAGATLLLCLVFLSAILATHNWDPFEFVRIGTRFSEGQQGGTEGYDGQFVYYLAQDPNPQAVEPKLDVPAYRYQRILLPMLARFVSFGSDAALAWALPVISLIAHIWAVYVLGRIFEIWKVSRWYALVYGLWVGNLLALRLDLPEPLAFSLILTALWLELRQKGLPAAVFYSLAIFAKETTIFFVAAQGLVYLTQRRWKDALQLTLLAGLPFIAFRLFLLNAFGSMGFGSGGAGSTAPELIPFNGLLRVSEYSTLYQLALVAVYLPAIIFPAMWGLFSAVRKLSSWHPRVVSPGVNNFDYTAIALALNAAIYPFLPLSLYIELIGALRLATGLQLALLLYAGRFNITRVLRYSPLWLVLNVLVIRQFFG